MNFSSPKIKKLLYFRRELAKPEKQAKKIHSEEISYISLKKVIFTFQDDC